MLRIETILGSADSEPLAAEVHSAAHAGRLETVRLGAGDVSRRRMRVVTDHGTDVAIALSRSERLHDGAVLACDGEHIIVVRVDEIEWLPLTPADPATAVELGYHAGNLHWRVRFSGATLFVGLEGPVATYLARLKPLLASGRIVVGTPVTGAAGPEPEPHRHADHGHADHGHGDHGHGGPGHDPHAPGLHGHHHHRKRMHPHGAAPAKEGICRAS
ncbi:urease accessory protein UreE [Amorphus coralli]|uniref:urease accessory protein UreE n=1 Tax=Amorphus coralli TaxID=340680 RepID=UPI00037850C3|nr:urease accessory protein UreE [Amorphus coralli]